MMSWSPSSGEPSRQPVAKGKRRRCVSGGEAAAHSESLYVQPPRCECGWAGRAPAPAPTALLFDVRVFVGQVGSRSAVQLSVKATRTEERGTAAGVRRAFSQRSPLTAIETSGHACVRKSPHLSGEGSVH